MRRESWKDRRGGDRLGGARSRLGVLAGQARARRGARRSLRPRVADVAARRRPGAEGAGRRRARRAGDPRRRRAARLRGPHRPAARGGRQRQRQGRAHRGRRRAAARGGAPRRRARRADRGGQRRGGQARRAVAQRGRRRRHQLLADRRLPGGARRAAARVRRGARRPRRPFAPEHRGHRLPPRRRGGPGGPHVRRHDRGTDRGRCRRRVDAQPRPARRHQDPALPGAPPALHHRAAERGRADASDRPGDGRARIRRARAAAA